MWKNIASFVFGFALGGVTVYFATKESFKKEEEEAINSIREYYRDKDIQRDKNMAEELNKRKSEMAEDILNAKSEAEHINYTNKYTEKEEHQNHKPKEGKRPVKEPSKKDIIQNALNEYEEELEDSTDIFYDEEEEEEKNYYPSDYTPTEQPAPIPFAISPNEFANGRLYYEKMDLAYYEDDDILIDEYSENIIDDLMNTVGAGFKSKFDEYETGVAYIRNEKIGTDYCIVKHKGSYFNEE